MRGGIYCDLLVIYEAGESRTDKPNPLKSVHVRTNANTHTLHFHIDPASGQLYIFSSEDAAQDSKTHQGLARAKTT